MTMKQKTTGTITFQKGSRLPFLSRRRRMKNDCQNFSKEVLERNADSFNNQSSANN
jgi:hypothetical protein